MTYFCLNRACARHRIPVVSRSPRHACNRCRQPLIGRSRQGNPCAWCLKAAGMIQDISGVSHGICARHVADLKAQIAARKAVRA